MPTSPILNAPPMDNSSARPTLITDPTLDLISGRLIQPFTSTAATYLRVVCTGLLTLLLALALTGIGRQAGAAVKVAFELKEGDKISDITKIVVKAESADGIDKVEFRVDDKLRYTGSSIPYTFEWDTLADKEGAHMLTATAFDSNGQTARASISVTVDNELNTGADALAQKALDAISTKDLMGARRYSRRALKADPGNVNGARALASVYYFNNDYDKAIATLDKAIGLDASPAGLQELASYRIRRALQPDNAASFFGEVQAVIDLRRKAADINIAAVTKQNAANTPAAHDAIGDALLAAGRFHEAVAEYIKSGLEDNTPVPSYNRYALALIADGRPIEAIAALKSLQITKKDDAQTRAVIALAHLRQQQFAEARKLVTPDLADHVVASLIVASYADNALGKRNLAAQEAADAIALAPNLGEAQYALAISTTKPDLMGVAIGKAITLSPFQSGPYIDYTSDQMLSKRQDRYEQALNVTDLVLKAEPKNVQARLIQALIHTQQRHFADAQPLLADLQKNYPESPDVLVTIGTFYSVQGNSVKSTPFFDVARKIDPLNFNYTAPPAPMELAYKLRRSHVRADFYLTPAALYPAN